MLGRVEYWQILAGKAMEACAAGIVMTARLNMLLLLLLPFLLLLLLL